MPMQQYTANKQWNYMKHSCLRNQCSMRKTQQENSHSTLVWSFTTLWNEKRWEQMVNSIWACWAFVLSASHSKAFSNFMQMLNENFLAAFLSCWIDFSNKNAWSNFIAWLLCAIEWTIKYMFSLKFSMCKLFRQS